ncbi:MAG TPA: potassium-transporting ATPase subunit KdpC [Geobacteraceae bacterium]|nr:potassium-transporting ATPase subunit KdpC [Geobacteraceae bacterium]
MKEIKPAIMLLIAFTLICGGIYPAIVTGFAQALFPKQANGSFITDKSGRTVGSSLIGQPFSDPKYFWPRPSSAGNFSYNPSASGGSNLGPTNHDYIALVEERVMTLRNSGITGNVPSEMVQASGSGLDPHISPEAAKIQIPRVAGARGMDQTALQKLVDAHVEDRQLGIFGNRRVNVLALNLALDKLAQ